MIAALLVGGLAGFAGAKTDFLLMRLVDLMISVPQFFVMLLLVVGAVALMGVPAFGKLRQQSGCAATVTQPVARPDCGV